MGKVIACKVGQAEQEFQHTNDMVVSAVTVTLRLVNVQIDSDLCFRNA